MPKMRLMVTTSDLPGHVTVQLHELRTSLVTTKPIWKLLDEREQTVEYATFILNQQARIDEREALKSAARLADTAHDIIEGAEL
jgi:hypothetical protein